MDTFELTVSALLGAATPATTPTNNSSTDADAVLAVPVDADSQANYGSYCVVA
jgi:hypothetical protein